MGRIILMLFILAHERKLTPFVIQKIKNLPKEKLPIAIQMGVLILSNFQVLIADKVKSRTLVQGK
jgi:hypothetical protein